MRGLQRVLSDVAILSQDLSIKEWGVKGGILWKKSAAGTLASFQKVDIPLPSNPYSLRAILPTPLSLLPPPSEAFVLHSTLLSSYLISVVESLSWET